MKKQYRSVPEGMAGTYLFNDGKNPFHPIAIGTKRCATCVGVYFQIDESCCFVGHIRIPNFKPKNPGWRFQENIVGGNDSQLANERLKAGIKERLTAESEAHNWGGPNQMMRDTLVLICPNPNALHEFLIPSDNKSATEKFKKIPSGNGAAVKEGIKSWLNTNSVKGEREIRIVKPSPEKSKDGLDENKEKHLAENVYPHGFVIGKPGEEPQFLYDHDESEEYWIPLQAEGEEWCDLAPLAPSPTASCRSSIPGGDDVGDK